MVRNYGVGFKVKKAFRRRKAGKKVYKIGKFGGRITMPHLFKRTFTFGARNSAVTNTLYDTLNNIAIPFALNDLPNASEFVNLFDQYRILKVVVKARPYLAENNTTISSITNANVTPYVHVVTDYDDATPLSVVADYQQYQNYSRHSMGRGFTRVIYPAVAIAMYQTAVSTGYGNKRKQWIDCANSTVPHYGIKFGINGAGLGVTTSYAIDTELTYYMEFRHVR